MTNELSDMLLESLDKVFRKHCTNERIQELDHGGFDADLWGVVEELGFKLAGLTEEEGGAGATTLDLVSLLRLAGRYCAPIPLAENMMIGPWLLVGTGLKMPLGPFCVGPAMPQEELLIKRSTRGWVLSGRLHQIGWPHQASRILSLARSEDQYFVVIIDLAKCKMEPVLNLAGETRATIIFDAITLSERELAPAQTGISTASIAQRGALARAALISGTLERALQLSLEYVGERKQFGQPLRKFQAIQQQLAIFAGEVVAAKAMTEQAATALDQGPAPNTIAAAKIRTGQAAGVGARIAHQVHGAMGFAQEYSLHHATRRLWAWRDENGSERYWSGLLGKAVASRGAENLWPMITGI